MTDGPLVALTLLAVLGTGLVAGVFFAFSSFVMRALASLPPAQGAAAMQSVNRTVLNPVFLGVFAGTALLSVALVVLSIVRGGGAWLLAGAVSYLAGTFILTRVVHVPRNDALMRVAADSAEGAEFWTGYVPAWTRWNHVRMLASLTSCAFFVIALVNS
ncbi:anthrone oxygenase family protein [Prauserella flavalba]|uniref:anthrone oxygenase family protein n=1 Tax=Prauserella flavalba TaxID=1477506 RepID=UPI0036EFE476